MEVEACSAVSAIENECVMEITFTYTGQLARAAGVSEEAVKVAPGTALSPVLNELAQRHGKTYEDLVMDGEGRIRPSLLVILDGEQFQGEKAAILLQDVRNVTLMTPIAGG